MAFGSIVPSLSAFLIIISATVALAQQPGRVVARFEVEGLAKFVGDGSHRGRDHNV